MVVLYVKVAATVLLPSKLPNVQVAEGVPLLGSAPPTATHVPAQDATEPVSAVAVKTTCVPWLIHPVVPVLLVG